MFKCKYCNLNKVSEGRQALYNNKHVNRVDSVTEYLQHKKIIRNCEMSPLNVLSPLNCLTDSSRLMDSFLVRYYKKRQSIKLKNLQMRGLIKL